MIVFELACECGFTFEGWFQDRRDFENQQTAAFLVCPDCGSKKVRKILSPIRTQSSKNDTPEHPEKGTENSATLENVMEALKTVQEFVEENFEDVGTDMAAESLKIHYGVSKPRNIRGVTTELEEKRLKDEGINLLKIPMPAKGNGVN